MNTIANGFKEKRKAKNLLLIEVSNGCGLYPSTILKIEMGTHSNTNDIQKLSSFYSN
ncbi:hypothetical protein DFO73_105139 [Cytobacillus oceanisediminis]|jgi:transcriptional regulator with XRE-family HTH domain|uniref:Helix-turn-helix protein n=1 Tax=Cytobacillus oceanisediminis TaxID=665099 RepID=A0A2V2ZYY4_9BACI|nr:hypothetical protein [Cytobacillus oceanisediminis]PWW28902.1 hypothetical protein DFO73_105139 [Cytobacillus oceanisediminis]